jgi:hypothetical protein
MVQPNIEDKETTADNRARVNHPNQLSQVISERRKQKGHAIDTVASTSTTITSNQHISYFLKKTNCWIR